MYKNKKILAIIPARSGSRGLPGKNTRMLCGKPLIAWTIIESLSSKYLDKVAVSTDDGHIAMLSKRYKAQAPFIRPKKLATSSAKVIDVLIHAIGYFENIGERYDLIMLLQPTSPLRRACDINGSIELFFKKKAQAIISVCQNEHHPWWSNTLETGFSMAGFNKKAIANKNRQFLPVFYRINGAIYLADTGYLKTKKSFLGKDTFAFIMPQERSVDIDNKLDFDFAQFLMQNAGNDNVKKY